MKRRIVKIRMNGHVHYRIKGLDRRRTAYTLAYDCFDVAGVDMTPKDREVTLAILASRAPQRRAMIKAWQRYTADGRPAHVRRYRSEYRRRR